MGLEGGVGDEELSAFTSERGHLVGDRFRRVWRGSPDRGSEARELGPAVVRQRRKVLLNGPRVFTRLSVGGSSQDLGGVESSRPSLSAYSQTSMPGGSIPRFVRAVQTWLRWSVP
jgi:hypothetical protein